MLTMSTLKEQLLHSSSSHTKVRNIKTQTDKLPVPIMVYIPSKLWTSPSFRSFCLLSLHITSAQLVRFSKQDTLEHTHVVGLESAWRRQYLQSATSFLDLCMVPAMVQNQFYIYVTSLSFINIRHPDRYMCMFIPICIHILIICHCFYQDLRRNEDVP